MSSIVISGDTSGSVTLDAPAIAGSTVLTLPATSGTLVVNNTASTITFADGSATTPSITNIGDTNTGMFFPAEDTIAFTEGGVESMRIDSSGYITNAVSGMGNGRVQGYQYYQLNSGFVGANVNTAQSIFGVGVTLAASTVYEFESLFMIGKTSGSSSHTVSIGFGGTATLNNIGYEAIIRSANTSSNQGAPDSAQFMTTASATQVTGATSNATNNVFIIIKGTVSVNAGGTFIPQYTLSAAPGGAYTTQIGSYFKISPLAASGANVSIGTWT